MIKKVFYLEKKVVYLLETNLGNNTQTQRDTRSHHRCSVPLTVVSFLQIYNMIPWLGPFLENWKILMKNLEKSIEDMTNIIADLRGSLDPATCRCFVDAFLTRKLKLEVRRLDFTRSPPRMSLTDPSLRSSLLCVRSRDSRIRSIMSTTWSTAC